jgi:Tfp pilus assembly protein PilF
MDQLAKEIVQKAVHLAAQKEYREAIELLYEVVDRFPQFVTGFEMIGDFYLRTAQPALAIRPLEMALEIDQESFFSHFLLGCAYGRVFRFDDAIEELEIAREIKPEDAEVLRNLGWITCMSGNLEKGRKHLMQALEMNSRNGLIYNDLAASYLFSQTRNLEKAHYWLEKALEVEPNEPFIQQTYQAFLETKQSMEAMQTNNN